MWAFSAVLVVCNYGPDWYISTATGWTAMKSFTKIHSLNFITLISLKNTHQKRLDVAKRLDKKQDVKRVKYSTSRANFDATKQNPATQQQANMDVTINYRRTLQQHTRASADKNKDGHKQWKTWETRQERWLWTGCWEIWCRHLHKSPPQEELFLQQIHQLRFNCSKLV